MATFNSKNRDRFKCDECQKIFTGRKIVLKEKPDNMHILFKTVVAITKDGEIIQSSYEKLDSTDRLLHCPFCDTVHFDGFDKVDKKKLEKAAA